MMRKVRIFLEMIKFEHTLFALPFAFVGVYPAAYFLERSGDDDIAMAFLTPVVGLVFAGIGLAVWNHGVKRYRGAGS